MMSRQQVYWRCRRATLELDLLFNDFFAKHYDLLDEVDKNRFIGLLQVDDQLLIGWFFQSLPCDQKEHQVMVEMILRSKQ